VAPAWFHRPVVFGVFRAARGRKSFVFAPQPELAELNGEQWCLPEALRVKGELELMQGSPGAAARAEKLFLESMDLAREQGALSWSLRTAVSLARASKSNQKIQAAREPLESIFKQFTEGFATADLAAAKTLLLAMN
jgi:hypothetical protein